MPERRCYQLNCWPPTPSQALIGARPSGLYNVTNQDQYFMALRFQKNMEPAVAHLPLGAVLHKV